MVKIFLQSEDNIVKTFLSIFFIKRDAVNNKDHVKRLIGCLLSVDNNFIRKIIVSELINFQRKNLISLEENVSALLNLTTSHLPTDIYENILYLVSQSISSKNINSILSFCQKNLTINSDDSSSRNLFLKSSVSLPNHVSLPILYILLSKISSKKELHFFKELLKNSFLKEKIFTILLKNIKENNFNSLNSAIFSYILIHHSINTQDAAEEFVTQFLSTFLTALENPKTFRDITLEDGMYINNMKSKNYSFGIFNLLQSHLKYEFVYIILNILLKCSNISSNNHEIKNQVL